MAHNAFRSIAVFALTVTSLAVPVLADAQVAATPVSLSGTWNVGMVGDHIIPAALVLEQSGTALKGTFIFMGKDYPVTGQVTGGTFSVTGQGPSFGTPTATHPPAAGSTTTTATATVSAHGNGLTADMTIKGATGADGSLTGELLTKMGERTGMIKWTAERLKERKTSVNEATAVAVQVTGKWTMSIVEAQLTVAVDLKQVGNTVTGTAESDHLGLMKLAGTIDAGVLSFSTVGTVGGQEVKLDYSGKYNKDGAFAGGLTGPTGAMTWTMAPVKK